MKTDILLFTQTMGALLSSFLPLQSALSVCKEILAGKTDKKLAAEILKDVSEGKRLSDVLARLKTFPQLYIALVSIGEESGSLAQTFGHLAAYLKDKRSMRRKIAMALLYPILVLATAAAVSVVLAVFVMPRLEGIFEAFSGSAESVGVRADGIKLKLFLSAVTVLVLSLIIALCAAAHKASKKAAYIMDSALLRIPLLKDFAMTIQMHDFSFAMKLMTQSRFPIERSLAYAKDVLGNARVKKAVESVCQSVASGKGISESFECEKVFPKYLTVWIKIAEENGQTEEAFNQICDYYQNESESILTGITQAAEPVFILITGAIIIAMVAQFVIPAFNLLGAL